MMPWAWVRSYFKAMRSCSRGHDWAEVLGYGYICRQCGEAQRGY